MRRLVTLEANDVIPLIIIGIVSFYRKLILAKLDEIENIDGQQSIRLRCSD